MSKPEIYFVQEDIQKGKKFADMLDKKCTLSLTPRESLDFAQLLVWYNNLIKKLEAHIMELKSYEEAKEEPEDKSNKKAKK